MKFFYGGFHHDIMNFILMGVCKRKLSTSFFGALCSLLQQTSDAASYTKFVSREMSKAEALLKVAIKNLDVLRDNVKR